jgi:hypothetical protein
MKYIEELCPGDSFELNKSLFLLTSDFKKNGERLAISMTNGSSKWMASDCVVDTVPLFYLDANNNTLPIKHVPSPSYNIY